MAIGMLKCPNLGGTHVHDKFRLYELHGQRIAGNIMAAPACESQIA